MRGFFYLLLSFILKYRSVDNVAIVALNQPKIVNKSLLKIKEDISEEKHNINANM